MSGSAVQSQLKTQVHDFWNRMSCGTDTASSEKFSRAYFDEIEEYRYRVEPEVFSFAQFPRWHGKDVLEVGVGAGTDFLQWVRSGARAHGVDLTEEAVEHVRRRLAVYGLEAADVRVGDAENLPYDDDSFDLVYSWGVIHHAPDTGRALRELLRVTRPGGTVKVMVYNRHSVSVLLKWVWFALLRGRPYHSLAWVMWHHQESIGTKAYTLGEIRRTVAGLPARLRALHARPTWKYDLYSDRPLPFRLLGRSLAALLGPERSGFFLCFELEKAAAGAAGDRR